MRTIAVELGLDDPDDEPSLRAAVARKLGLGPADLPELVLRKKSLDARKGRVRFHYLFELLAPGDRPTELGLPHPVEVGTESQVVVVGDGPCGLFCAYELARRGIACTVVDRGKLVQPRRKDLKGLTRRGTIDPDSNYCFGEGGAGTYSDGKLYTRAHKRGDVRDIIEILALHGAPEAILTDARPHIGSNRLPQVVTAMRERLQSLGVRFVFGQRVTEILLAQATEVATGGRAAGDARRPASPHARRVVGVRFFDGSELGADHLVLATGHSARDIFEMLHRAGHGLQAKPFALGTRVEHPQGVVNRAQYGAAANHIKLPNAAYRLVDSRTTPSAFSFCMCPGGFIVPASTAPGELVVNGMSLSRRSSRYANSGIVVGIEPADLAQAGFHGVMAGVEFQRLVEQAGFAAGGSTLSAPATRVTDFMKKKGSSTTPDSSYVPGLTATDIAEVLDAGRLSIAARLREAFRFFDQKIKGYVSEEGVLVGVESRTSSPVRIPRNGETLMSDDWYGLYPAGEGSGYAGGIVSAAVDGIRVARAIAHQMRG